MKYIIFYTFENGVGNCELNLKKRIKNIDDIRQAENMLKQELNKTVSVTNYKRVGLWN